MVFALATRRAARGRSAAAILLTLIATASVAGFAVAGWKTLDGAEQAIGWQLVGAPFRVSTDPTQTLPAGFDASAIPGVTAVAPASTRDGVIAAQHTLLVGLDTPTYDSITKGTPGDLQLPPEMLTGLPAGADAVPAIASTSSDLQPGDRGVFSFGDKYLTFQVVRVSDSFPLVNNGDRFLVVAQDHLATARSRARRSSQRRLHRRAQVGRRRDQVGRHQPTEPPIHQPAGSCRHLGGDAR